MSHGQKSRTPRYFPRMKYRARARRQRMLNRGASYDLECAWFIVPGPRGRRILITAEEIHRGGLMRPWIRLSDLVEVSR